MEKQNTTATVEGPRPLTTGERWHLQAAAELVVKSGVAGNHEDLQNLISRAENDPDAFEKVAAILEATRYTE